VVAAAAPQRTPSPPEEKEALPPTPGPLPSNALPSVESDEPEGDSKGEDSQDPPSE
jgi:hypothetical protein